MKIKTNDFVMALLLLAVSGVLYQQTTLVNTTVSYALGPVFFPRVLIGILAVLSAALLIQSVRGGGAAAAKKDAEPGTLVYRWGLVALIVAYLLLLPLLGYVPATILFLMGGMCLLGSRTPRSLVVYTVVSAAVTFGLQFIFGHLLKLFLP